MINVIGVEATIKRLEEVDRSLRVDVVKDITHEVFDEVVKGASKHHQTGVMEDNISMRIKGEAGIVWIDDKNMLKTWRGKEINYASFVLFGSKPHKIEAKNKKALKWAGLAGFVKSVNHPGYKGDNFLKDGAKNVLNRIDEIVGRNIDGI